MKCILIFTSANELVYSKYDKMFAKHVKKLAKENNWTVNDKVGIYTFVKFYYEVKKKKLIFIGYGWA